MAKPGIIYGNAIAAIGGYFLAAQGSLDIMQFLTMLIGLSLVIGSACVFNNYIDRDLDKKMERTKRRALAEESIPLRGALIYGTVIGILGTLLLLSCNLLTALVGLVGFFAYVVVYGAGKRLTVHGTLIGSISGATPPVVGYVAVQNNLDAGALLLFMILVLWQMPHFYAIAIYRRKDYLAANIPVLPIKKGIEHTKVQIMVYTILFVITTLLLSLYGYTGYIYFIVMLCIGIYWLRVVSKGFSTHADERWARKVFKTSLVVLIVFSGLLSLEAVLP